MERIHVESSTIEYLSYDENAEILELTFTNGATYRYGDVRSEEFNDLLHAPSKGRYFNKHLRFHPYKKVA
jgi:hypothetical protein